MAAICTPVLAVAATHSAAKKTPAKKAKKSKKKKGLTASKIRAAVAAAERSPGLWATVNVCTSSTTQDYVGIRGEMPGLGFPTTMDMNISVSYWDYGDNVFQSVPGASQPLRLGNGSHGLRQGGVNFPFTPPAAGTQYLVRGTVTFEWRKAGKVLGKVTRNTGHGYTNVADSNPPGLNEGTCTLSTPATTPTTTTTTTPTTTTPGLLRR
jgi:hypothetical protein